MVVITIIGILATGAIVTYTTQIQKARDTTRVEDLKAIQSAVDQYYSDKTVYPDPAAAAPTGTTPATPASGHISLISEYIARIPKDTKTGSPCNAAVVGTASP